MIAASHVASRPMVVLALVLLAFVLLQCLLPLRTAVKIGADEDFELSKATLCLNGYHLYSEIWNDQPPLDTFLISQILKHISPSILGPRLLTVGFALVLLSSVFLLGLRVNGLSAAALATVLLGASPGFVELSSSCMQEVPALAPVAAALALLLAGRHSKWRITEILAGIIFAAGLQIKLIAVIYLPLVLLVVWLRERGWASPLFGAGTRSSAHGREGRGERKPFLGSLLSLLRTHWSHEQPLTPDAVGTLSPSGGERERVRGRFMGRVVEDRGKRAATIIGSFRRDHFYSLLAFGASLAIGFVLLNGVTGNPLWLQLRQSWAAHFAAARSFEHGSPGEHPFDWSVLLKNWDTTVPAALGVIFLLRQVRRTPAALLPIGWLALTFVVFPSHVPWWSYYYLHNSIPLCWCAAAGMGAVWQWTRTRRKKGALALGIVYAVCAFSWMGGRVYLQVTGIRDAERISSALVLKEIERFKPFVNFLFADQPIYSFHSGIPMPPRLAMISLKRFWSGDMNNARLVAEMQAVKPGLILLANDTRMVPFQTLIEAEYRMVYQDADHRLYAQKAVIAQAE